MKLGNKVINYNIYAKIADQRKQIANTTNAQLPSIENLSETIKGAGIMGEIDWPTLAAPGAMTFTFNARVSGEDQISIAAPKLQEIEVRFAVEKYDTNGVAVGVEAHKAVLKCLPKKCDPGKLEPGSPQDVSNEYSVIYYKHTIDGTTMLEVDSLNYIYIVHGVDYAKDIRAAL